MTSPKQVNFMLGLMMSINLFLFMASVYFTSLIPNGPHTTKYFITGVVLSVLTLGMFLLSLRIHFVCYQPTKGTV